MKNYIFIILVFFSSRSIAQNQPWSWKFPLPQGLDVEQMYFPSPDTGYGVGLSGTLIRTYDGGNTWLVNYNDSVSFLSVFFLDNNIGYISGYTSDFIAKTIDAGNTWTILYHQQGSPITSIFFKDQNTGYLNGGTFTTLDGGLTWNSGNIIGTHLHFINSMEGFALLGSTVRKSIDGGITWQNAGTIPGSSSFDITSLQFTSTDTGYALRQYPFKTVDGGITWFPLNTGNNVFKDLHFLDGLTGSMVGDNIAAFTSDGGANVNIVPINFYSSNYTFTNVHTVSATESFASGKHGAIIKTIDSGITWNLVKENFPIGINKIEIIGNTGLANGVLKTADGGQNWFSMFPPVNSNYIYDFKIIDSLKILIAGSEMLKTYDGGLTWQTIISNNSIGKYSFINKDTGYYSGQPFLKTTDGGTTWNPINSSLASSQDLFFTNENTGYIIENGLHKTIDGAQTWTQLNLTGTLHRVQFTSLDTGYVFATNNLGGASVLRTSDGGLNWTPVFYSPVGDIHFLDNDTGFLYSQPSIYYTTNSGLTWDTLPWQPMIWGPFIYTIYFKDFDNGFIGGNNTLLQYQSSGVGTSINEHNSRLNFLVYPNPTTNKINIEINNLNFSYFNLSIYDLAGKIVKEIKLPRQGNDQLHIIIDLDKFTGGVYFIKVVTENETLTEKIIISR